MRGPPQGRAALFKRRVLWYTKLIGYPTGSPFPPAEKEAFQAINKAMRAALKALSYPDIDLKKNYKLVRMAENVSHPPANKLFYKAWDHVVPCGDHEVAVRI